VCGAEAQCCGCGSVGALAAGSPVPTQQSVCCMTICVGGGLLLHSIALHHSRLSVCTPQVAVLCGFGSRPRCGNGWAASAVCGVGGCVVYPSRNAQHSCLIAVLNGMGRCILWRNCCLLDLSAANSIPLLANHGAGGSCPYSCCGGERGGACARHWVKSAEPLNKT
jgi:hypothetical protein